MAEPAFIDSSIANANFWPAVPIRRFIEAYRVPQDAKDAMIYDVLVFAIQHTNRKAGPLVSMARDVGMGSLGDYCAAKALDQIGGEYIAVHAYLQAVFAFAKAETLRLLQSVQRKPIAEGESNAMDATEQAFRDAHQQALSILFAEFGQAETANEGAYFSAMGAHDA